MTTTKTKTKTFVQLSIRPLVHWLNVNCQMSKIKCQMPKVNKVKLLTKLTSGAPPVIFYLNLLTLFFPHNFFDANFSPIISKMLTLFWPGSNIFGTKARSKKQRPSPARHLFLSSSIPGLARSPDDRI